jgi:hypothetical protein
VFYARGIKDLKAKLEKLRADAEDCDLIGRLATDKTKRDTFNKLAIQFRSAAADLEAVIAEKAATGEA